MEQKMTDAECRKLLGGYAAGTLTPEERDALFSAALSDPDLFAALADEQSLRDVLDDSSARAELLAAVEDRPFSITNSLRDWFERPKAKVLAAVGAVLLVAIAVRELRERMTADQTVAPQVIALNVPPSDTVPLPQHQNPAPQQQHQEKSAPPPRTAAPATPGRTPAASEAQKPATASVQNPPPEPSPPQATPVLDYTVVVVQPDGMELPTSADHEFGPDEKARIRVRSTLPGTLAARIGSNTLYAGTISPGTPVLLRRDLDFTNQDVVSLDLEFTPAAATSRGPRAASLAHMRSALRASEDGTQGVVGGVPAASPQLQEQRVESGTPAPPPAAPVHVRILLHRRK